MIALGDRAHGPLGVAWSGGFDEGNCFDLGSAVAIDESQAASQNLLHRLT